MKIIQNTIDCDGYLGGIVSITSLFDESPLAVTLNVYDEYMNLVDSGDFTQISNHVFKYEFQSQVNDLEGVYYLVMRATTSLGKVMLAQYEVELEDAAPRNYGERD